MDHPLADSLPAGAAPGPAAEPPQRVVKVRRDYNSWVASQTMEDYALRFTPRAFRKWSELRVANTAFGAASFLVLEAVGATLLVQYGFANAFWAILATGLIIFLAGLPISVYAARHGLDMDLLTRGAGFGYIGSTITSLIYASFTFIFFALEAAVMAYALELAFDIPPAWGYLLCALAVVPLVVYGVTTISRLQVWTQPLWLVMLVLPYVYVFANNPGILQGLASYGGEAGVGAGFELHAFGAALTVGIALITQMGEQADYLRFMPERRAGRRLRWWAATLIGGPGWVVLGVLKMLGGALLAYLVITHMVPADRAVDPNQMYLAAWEYVFPHYGFAIGATALFVIVSQLKINVTNAYAGSLAWSNFFARLTHSHPGRVVWMVFNTLIALALMEMNVFQALGHVLGLYANVAIAWMMAVVADLVVNKPLGLSPPGIEFKRAHLYDINPVGVGAMGIASVLSVVAHLGAFGPTAQAFSAVIALVTAFVASPLIAWATRGRYYIARSADAQREGAYGLKTCCICERRYEGEDMAHCPAYQGAICSLCCSLDARCNDLCKPQATLQAQWTAVLRRIVPRRMWPTLDAGLAHYLLLMLFVVPLLALLLGVVYTQGLRAMAGEAAELAPQLRAGLAQVYLLLLLVAGVVAWWLALAHRSRQVAQEESNRQTQALNEQTIALRREIDSHRRTDRQLQQAQRLADSANRAKTRYITTISHELRTPLNSILGYAQLLEEDDAMPAHRRQAVSVIRRGGDHLLNLIDGTLDIARIESGRLALDVKPMRFRERLQEIADLFELQAAGKRIAFRYEVQGSLPEVVRADEKRLRQILINLLGNAVKFTAQGQVLLRVRHAREMARFEIVDSGPGMDEDELERVFEPFVRGNASGGPVSGGTGLGLTISKMLTDLMGGEMTVQSRPGQGSTFAIRMFLPELRGALADAAPPHVRARGGYQGRRRHVLVVDNEEIDRGLLVSLLEPIGFVIHQAASGEECLAVAPRLEPDAIFMDLAMPGIDGWETIRRLRGLAGTADGAAEPAGAIAPAASQALPPLSLQALRTPVAIVSANAFDKGLENDVGIRAGDFLVKPVRLAELLDWLGDRLGLHWHDGPPAMARAAVPAPAEPLRRPPAERLVALKEAVSIGYPRGIAAALDGIEAEAPDAGAFVAQARALAQAFQFDALGALLDRGETSTAAGEAPELPELPPHAPPAPRSPSPADPMPHPALPRPQHAA